MIRKLELGGQYSIVLENDEEKAETMLSIANYDLIFTSKKSANEHIELLQHALAFWGYDDDSINN